jgi:curli production assembly/transport component CsgG
MRMGLRGNVALSVLVAALGLAGCQSTPPESVLQPVVTPVTQQSLSLRTLPPPRERVLVAVYDFPDLTGQYRERENVQTLSRAVTQGGAPMLIKALQDAGERRWFSVLDRARLDDILKERQIVTEMRRIYRNEERVPASVLPPLSYAGIIMQGGITGYDTNTKTGGIGARYLGIGADAKWVQDTVTVTLRAVSTSTGEVLSTVTVHKAIASYGIQGGAFRYVELDSILEAEAGITQNEPKQIAVQEAIEKAVVSLIIEGAELGVWAFADPVVGQNIIADYRREKYADAPVLEAQVPPPPDTRNAAKVVPTEPFAPRVARTVRRPAPAAVPVEPAPPPPPPAPEEDETVGSLPPGANAPPPAQPGETIGSLEPSGDGSPGSKASDKPQQVAVVSARL